MITIYGASDDLVEVDGCDGADEFNVIDEHWRGELIAPDGEQMAVHCWYGENGVWQIGVGQVDEKHPLPAWPLTITQHRDDRLDDSLGYSALLSIDAPSGTRLVNITPAPESE